MESSGAIASGIGHLAPQERLRRSTLRCRRAPAGPAGSAATRCDVLVHVSRPTRRPPHRSSRWGASGPARAPRSRRAPRVEDRPRAAVGHVGDRRGRRAGGRSSARQLEVGEAREHRLAPDLRVAEGDRDLLVVAGELRGHHDAVAPARRGGPVAVAVAALAGDDRARRMAREGRGVARRAGSPRESLGSSNGAQRRPTARPPANASRFAARSRDGRNVSPGRRRARAAAPLAIRAAAGPDRRPEAGRAAPRTRGPGRASVAVVAPGGASCGPTISSAGISSRNRDGTAHPAAAPGRPPPGVRQVQATLRARDADVREPPLLLQLLLVVERRGCAGTGPPRGPR